MPMSEIIHVEDKYYILATSPFADDRTRVLKDGDTFALYDRYGDVLPVGLGEQGVYHEGTRFLSQMTLMVQGRRPLLLSSTVIDTNDVLAVDLTNPDLFDEGPSGRELVIPHGAVHIFRSRLLWRGAVYERIRITNHSHHVVALDVELRFAADFADIFQVRGVGRKKRGRDLPPILDDGHVVLGYEGLDGVIRRSVLRFSPRPSELKADHARFRVEIAADREHEIFLTLACETDDRRPRIFSYEDAFRASDEAFREYREGMCGISSSSQQLDMWVTRSIADLFMLITRRPEGPYPYAGVPWFSTVFGRDGILTAFECLWAYPPLARGVLAHLAATQATEHEAERDAQPGKILHEARGGEMAALNEIPFGRYYGTVDATPLFVMLAGAYYDRTGDRAFIESIWANVCSALEWIDHHGDLDGDGFVEYLRETETGLANQGWKDAGDSVMYADGTLAEPPIALCEVQGYVYGAKLAAAKLATVLGEGALAARLERDAIELRTRFDAAFWCDDLGTYALALDGKKRPCRVRASNAGQCLWSGIALPHRAAPLAKTLTSPAMFSGWGIRTLAEGERRYNPMSYHNGSIWPHDNALIAHGLSRYGFRDEAKRVITALFDVSVVTDLHRLPELFCGFVRRRGEGPTAYPVACSPQAWAAGSSLLALHALMGLSIDAPRRRVSFTRPVLPPFVDQLEIRNLQVGDARLHLRLDRHPKDVGIRVLEREGEDVEIVVIK